MRDAATAPVLAPAGLRSSGARRAARRAETIIEAIDRYQARELLQFDCFVYWPERNYPEHMYGGWVERMGDWAYVHE